MPRVSQFTALLLPNGDAARQQNGSGKSGIFRVDRLVAFCYHFCMGQPVKISDGLVLDARLMGEATQRSIAGQIEFWARIGRAVEGLLRGDEVLALSKAGRAKPLSACLRLVGLPEGRRRLAEHLDGLPYPHYEPAPGAGGLLVRIQAGGKRTIGRFVNRKFEARRSARR